MKLTWVARENPPSITFTTINNGSDEELNAQIDFIANMLIHSIPAYVFRGVVRKLLAHMLNDEDQQDVRGGGLS